MRVNGTFEVADFTPAQVPAPDIKTGLPVGVATMRKTFAGGVSGRSVTIFSAAYDPATDTGTYVAMESFEGSLDGKPGAFNFAHSATTEGAGGGADYLVIVPASGTGALAGIRGTGGLDIVADGTHRIWFDYELG
ncbi:DUF3224 domain-containing protein [Actinoplanes sp. NPDC051411]|jgi:hypothetical protein|uniref:DUF3224 domain-containing protein n=1 Tax=Actinoplanes sp. NPDC051411 TaxID=3155522 RepID=UPI00342339B0